MDKMRDNCEIDNALRDLAQERDRRLGAAPTLPPAREELLTGFLREEFPVESVLGRVVIQKDRLLNLPSVIPAAVVLSLQERLAARRASHESSGPIFQRFLRSPFAAALTVCALITAAGFFDGYRKTPSLRHARTLKPDEMNLEASVGEDRWFLGQGELFGRRASIRRFDLDRTEPASLQVSFFTSSEMYFAEGNDVRLGLRLDLPVREVLLEQDLARTP